jgi:hypothetical protein
MIPVHALCVAPLQTLLRSSTDGDYLAGRHRRITEPRPCHHQLLSLLEQISALVSALNRSPDDMGQR